MVAHARWITYLKLKKYMGCSTDSATLLTWRHHACVMVKWSINDLKPGSRPANEITPSILSASVQLDGVLGRDKLIEDNPNMGKNTQYKGIQGELNLLGRDKRGFTIPCLF